MRQARRTRFTGRPNHIKNFGLLMDILEIIKNPFNLNNCEMLIEFC